MSKNLSKIEVFFSIFASNITFENELSVTWNMPYYFKYITENKKSKNNFLNNKKGQFYSNIKLTLLT